MFLHIPSGIWLIQQHLIENKNVDAPDQLSVIRDTQFFKMSKYKAVTHQVLPLSDQLWQRYRVTHEQLKGETS